MGTADGSGGALSSLGRFAVVQVSPPADEDPSATRALEPVEERLRSSLGAVMRANGYVRTVLEEADVAVAVDAAYTHVREYRNYGPGPEIIGMSTRVQTGTTDYYPRLSVAVDFIDLKREAVIWRVEAQGPPGRPDVGPEMEQKLARYLEQAPRARPRSQLASAP